MKPLSYYLAPVLLVLTAALAAMNWYVRPAPLGIAVSVVLLLAVMTLAYLFSLRRSDVEARRRASDEIRNAIVFAGLIMLIPLSAKLAAAFGAIDDGEVSKRVTMAILGAFFVFTGNAIPKTLTPLSSLQCDGARMQAFQRISGWTWVLTGLAYALAWLTLPLDLAKPVSVALMMAGMLVIITQIVRLRRTRQKVA
ncbi:MAG: hypothetical protein M3P06_19220 [Acidobacteriota bacterium]|nr:hypothetical protein [Acidobacteriota bacterium]